MLNASDISGGKIALHYERIREVFGGCPVILAIGIPETGKSTTCCSPLWLVIARRLKHSKIIILLKHTTCFNVCLIDNGKHGKMTPAWSMSDLL